MSYCFMSTQKIKTLGQMTAKYNHNYRKIEIENADPSLADRNEELVKLGNKENGDAKTYVDAFAERTSHLKHIRSNAVLGVEVITTFSREDNIDLETWKKENVKWLKDTFNKAGDGKDNVVNVVYHGDEVGNVHCHAMVIPIDDKGNLSASFYLDGSRALRDMQTSYADKMKQFGLKRGLEGIGAKHRDIKKFYADLNNAKNVPFPKRDETPFEYRDRVLESIEELQLAAMRERIEKDREAERKRAEQRIKASKSCREQYEKMDKVCSTMYEDMKASVEASLEDLTDDISQKRKTQAELTEKIQLAEKKVNELKQEVKLAVHKLDENQEVNKKINFYDNLQSYIDYAAETEPTLVQNLQESMTDIQDHYINNPGEVQLPEHEL